MYNLQNFRFDPKKSGEILKKWVKDAGYSYQEAGDALGYTLDTMNNIFAGKNKELGLERAFKISVLTGHSVCEYLRLMLEGEEIDFADQIHVLTDKPLHMVKYTDTLPPTHEPEHHEHEPDNATLDRFRRVHGEYGALLRQQTQQQIDTMERQHKSHNDEMWRMHEEILQRADAENTRLRKRCTWLSIALAVETVFIIGLFGYDLFNRDVGWFRSFFLPEGGLPTDSLRG